MKKLIAAVLSSAAIILCACSSAPNTKSVRNNLVECEQVAPTGSRVKTHVECLPQGGHRQYKIRTWADIEKERAN